LPFGYRDYCACYLWCKIVHVVGLSIKQENGIFQYRSIFVILSASNPVFILILRNNCMSNSWIGHTLNGRYQIEELLGQGGMSAVYRATDPNLRRAVAVKLIHSHLSDSPDFMRRFEEEAASVARLRHSNIIQVHDFDHENNTYYIVFEYIPGETLQAWLSRLNSEGRFLPVEQALGIAASVADALAYAHQRDLIHRDVKPANVMINVQGEPILMDFGIAKIVGGTQHTATGAVIGTARYMSPEQIKGEQIDVRTDLYSLGVMLFEMLSGQPPYQSDSAMTIMMMHIQDPVPNVLDLRPDVPASVIQIIHRALSKNPVDRYATASEMAAALRNALTSLEDDSSPVPGALAGDAPTVMDAEIPSAPPAVATPQTVTTAQAAAATPAPTQPAPASMPLSETSDNADGTRREGLKKWGMVGGAVALVLLLLVLGYNVWTGAADEDALAAIDSVALAETLDASVALTVAAAEAETAATARAASDGPDTTPSPEAAADLQPTSTPTPFPEVVITNIALVGDVYVVQYNSIGFEETMDGLHIHFFFDTIPPREAGRPFSNFYMYAGPSPYAELRLSDKPAEAAKICALVANADHTIQGESGNCFDLPSAPEETTATTTPSATTAAAAITGETTVSAATATPTATPTPSVQISNISEQDGVYIVTYSTTGFTEQLPGVHIHFFFDNVSPENAGLPHSGPWFVWGGPRPFDGYNVSDKPANAQRLCALVANADHTVRLGTGNCVYLPGSG
jgi:serine/threonine protein kinase